MTASGLPFLDMFFEAVSAVTTTGLTITSGAEEKVAVILFLRAFMQWCGGLGFVVFSLALVMRPGLAARQLSGRTPEDDDLVGSTRAHARIVLAVYCILTAVGIVLLLAAGQRVERAVIEVQGNADAVELGPYQVLSYGWSNITPWKSPRELPEDELEARIESLTADLEPGRPAIYNLHVPPYGTRIDDAPEIREDLSLVGGSSATMVPVGSTAVRRVLERHAPLLGLHGHIHESRGSARLGPTLCLNPGSDYNTGILKGVIVRLRGSTVEDVQFVAA